MIVDLLRFNRELRRLLDARATSGESLQRLPRAPPLLARVRRAADRARRPRPCGRPTRADAGSFPVRFLAEFFANHGMLGFRDRPQWSTVAGGSARYVEALTAPFRERIRLRTPVSSITRARRPRRDRRRGRASAERYRPGGDRHPLRPGAARCSATPASASTELLGAIPYQRNEAVLHTDSTLLPRRRAARSAWNFHLLREPKPLSTVTYYMNHLQRLSADRDFCVTLNRTEAIDPAKIIRTIAYAHPVYTPAGVAAQARARDDQRPARGARTTAAPTGAGAFTRTACAARCAPASRSG